MLGISSAMLEEEKARILGSLGVKAWGNPGSSTVIENPRDDVGSCLSRKRRNTASEAPRVPAPVCGMTAPSPSEVSGLFDAHVHLPYLAQELLPRLWQKTTRRDPSLFRHAENHSSSALSQNILPSCVSPTQVAELEDECLSQHLRIQQLELQVSDGGAQNRFLSYGFPNEQWSGPDKIPVDPMQTLTHEPCFESRPPSGTQNLAVQIAKSSSFPYERIWQFMFLVQCDSTGNKR